MSWTVDLDRELARHERDRYDRDDVLARVYLPGLVERYSGEGRQNGDRWTFRCPNPQHTDNNPSFRVERHEGVWLGRCWSQCDWRGNAIDLLVWLEGVEFPEALERLGREWGVARSSVPFHGRTSRPQPVARRREWKPPQDTSQPVPPERARAVLERFCAERGWRVETAELFGLSVVAGRDERPRVRFPFTYDGEVVWWQDRAAWPCDKKDRWRSPTGSIAQPFGVDRVDLLDDLDGDDLCFWITEGPTDAVALADGCPEVIALGIPGGSFAQLAPIVARMAEGLDVYTVLDNDEPGDKYRQVVDDACREHHVPVWHVRPPAEHNDLADWRRAAGDDFREQLVVATMAALDERGWSR